MALVRLTGIRWGKFVSRHQILTWTAHVKDENVTALNGKQGPIHQTPRRCEQDVPYLKVDLIVLRRKRQRVR